MSFLGWLRDTRERFTLSLDERFRDAHREPDGPHPAGCTCVRCDKTVPDAPCEHPAAERYELDTSRGRWHCGACGDPCEAPAVRGS